jgi:hypothetical protein
MLYGYKMQFRSKWLEVGGTEWGSGDRISGGRNRRSKVFMIRRSNYFASFQEIKILSVAKLQT